MSGLTQAGFDLRRLEEILSEMDAELRAQISEDLTLGADTVLGQVRAVVAAEISLVWETLALQYNAIDPNVAQGDQLDMIGRFYLLPRLGGVRATGDVTLSGDPGTVVPGGTELRDPVTRVSVETTTLVVVPSGGSISVPVQTLDDGEVISSVNGITSIVTPIAGLDAVTSSTLLTGGRARESDLTYRLRILASAQVNAGTEGAIRTALLQVEGVDTALVLSNRSGNVDSIGTPAHAVRVVIDPDQTGNSEREQDIARAIFDRLGAGIESFGDGVSKRTASVVDVQGVAQSVSWEYVVEESIYVALDFEVLAEDSTLDQADNEALAKQAIVDYINGLGVGDNVSTLDLLAAVTRAVPGAYSVQSLALDKVPGPTNTASLGVAFNRRAVASADDVTVSVTLV